MLYTLQKPGNWKSSVLLSKLFRN